VSIAAQRIVSDGQTGHDAIEKPEKPGMPAMSWTAPAPERYAGEVVGNGQCVAFVETAAQTPRTAEWKRGALVRDSDVATGTAVATFDLDGTYGNHTDGRSHAAIFVEQQDDGILVWDQWRNHPVAQRVIHFRGGEGNPVNDGDQFYVIEQT
jgi:hypothetical protein